MAVQSYRIGTQVQSGSNKRILSQTQEVVNKINILLQEIHDIKIHKKRNNIFNDHKTHPKDIDVKNVQDDTHLIYNNTSSYPLPYKTNNPRYHALDPTHVPDTDDNAFMQQKQAPYELWSTSPPELLSSSSSNEDLTDNNANHGGYAQIKTSLPRMRGRTEEECPGPSSSTVTKLSGPEPDPESGCW